MNINKICFLSLFVMNSIVYSGMLPEDPESGEHNSDRFVLSKGYVPKNTDNEFFKSIKNGDRDTFSRLIDAGESISQLNRLGFDPLYFAVKHHQDFMCDILLHKGANFLFKTNPKNICTFARAMQSDDEKIREVFKNYILELYGHECNAIYDSNELIMSINHNDIIKFNILIPAHESKDSIMQYVGNMCFFTSDDKKALKQRNKDLTKSINERYGHMLRIAFLFALRERHYHAVQRLLEYDVHNRLCEAILL